MRRARFRLVGRFDGARGATVTILHDGADGLMSVRPLRRRREFTLPLSRVAQWLVEEIYFAEHAERRLRARRRR